ncbi:SusD/RagB family nutrient-binding outer membrane lipoprotein [Rhodocytophaga aerolata]|uniref:SusD/RagB family nutrient-binding outer membrane lipoprotein n=1 Tax=Rhodocytophaga aerolata TaxID=455078 RepID=A0ABT8RDJ8_9BACT|nr:SusD/RagB family nutrient-binding outer membrane lipoprotein [Rhodocytophaga aerolata]MDO1450179.1 SusD/RagB family nutrient-binding outer membrane lipoprotein [Rhodocytophaga aerolata]
MNKKFLPLRKLYILPLTLFVLLLSSCDLQEANVNPNVPAEAPLSVVLTGAQGTLAYNLGLDAGLLSATVMQQAAGSNGDATANDNYTAIPGRFNGIWVNFYSNVLKELSIIIDKGQTTNAPYYTGIARVLTAFTYGTLTDTFGDIPFSSALQGRENTAPTYDSQQQVYEGIQTLLDQAIADLNQPATSFTTAPPGADDLVFKGNVQNWLAVAWTLKARYALHLSKLDATTAATQALAYLYEGGPDGKYRGITTNAGDAQVVFGAAQTNANPFYQQNTSRPGWVGLGASFVNLLNGNEVTAPSTQESAAVVDPRRAYFATPYQPGKYRGGVAGIPGAFSLIGPYYGSTTSPVAFITYAEAKLIEAEARLILNASDPKAQTALTEAVTASFNKVVSNAADPDAIAEKRAAYLAAKATLTGEFAIDLKTIITQKYIALFLQPEPWVDYRRTGYPELPLAVNATHSLNPGGQIARRFPYPQDEQSLNKQLPGPSNYQEPRLWWDKP